MSEEAPDQRDNQYNLLFDLPHEELDFLHLDALYESDPHPNPATSLPPTTPEIFTPALDDEVFYVDATGTSIGCASARLLHPAPTDLVTAHLDKPELQTHNIFRVHKVCYNPPYADGTMSTTYVLRPKYGRGQDVNARAQNLVKVGVRPGESYLVRRPYIDIKDPREAEAYEMCETRHSLLVKATWVSNWQIMYRVVHPGQGAEVVFAEGTLRAASLS